jgi:hypothetical protein
VPIQQVLRRGRAKTKSHIPANADDGDALFEAPGSTGKVVVFDNHLFSQYILVVIDN